MFRRPFFTGGRSTVQIPRADLGPFDLTHRNRAYYYFVLLVLVVVLLVVGHLRRSGVGRLIVGVRENEQAAAAMTISPARVKLTAFALAGFLAGLGGALLGAHPPRSGRAERFFLVERLDRGRRDGRHRRARQPRPAPWSARCGSSGCPPSGPTTTSCRCSRRASGCCSILLYLPGGFAQIGYWVRDRLLRGRRSAACPVAADTAVERRPPALVARARPRHEAAHDERRRQRARDARAHGPLRRARRRDGVDVRARPGEVIGLIGNNGAGKSTLLNAIGGVRAEPGDGASCSAATSAGKAHQRAHALGLGRTFQAATLYPELTVRETRAARARGPPTRTSFWGTARAACRPLAAPSAPSAAEAAELIDFLGLGRYADRYIAELSTGTRRIVELATVLAVGPRVICLDEPTAGVAQREAEAFGPLITRVQAELDATLIIVEHDLPMVMSISDRVYCLEAGRVIAEGPPDEVRNDPRVVGSYLGTDERAIAAQQRAA